MNILNICSSDERSALELGVAEVAGIVLSKKKFLSPDSALGFGSKLDAADAHRIHNSKKSPDAEEGGVEAESSPLAVCNAYERGGKATREAFFIVCSRHPLFFHSPWLS